MENMYFKNREEYRKYLNDHVVKRLGTHASRDGVCSLMDNGYVVKALYDEYYPNFAFQFKDFDIPSYIFSKTGAFVDGFVVAVFMDYAKGESVEQHKPIDQEIITLGTHLDLVAKDTKTIGEQGVKVNDFHCGNIIYDSNIFKIIDTLVYDLLTKGDYSKDNIYEVMNRLLAGILDDIMKYRIIRERYSFLGNLDYLENPKAYLIELKKFIEELTEKPINTLKEADNALKMKL